MKLGDIDIDLADRNQILSKIRHVPAYIKSDDKKHNTGVYIQDIPLDIKTGYANFDYKENDNLIKVDFLNFSILDKFISNEQLDKLINIEPDWSLLKDKDFVEKTTHIHKWYTTIVNYDIDSVDKLAMFLSLIRPGKDHLKNKNWDQIEQEVWKSDSSGYTFKKSHAYSYALTIVALMNLESGK